MPIIIKLLRIYRGLRARKSVSLVLVLIFVLISIFGNAICFYIFEGSDITRPEDGPSWEDALWYSVVSITTIGYGDYSASTLGSRLGTFFFIVLLGLATFTTFLSMMIDWGTDLALKGRFGMGNIIASDHVLIVNFPSAARVRRLIEELQSDPSHHGRETVVVSDQVERLPFSMDNVLFVHGPTLEKETYERAKVDRAEMAVVLATSYDDANSDAVVASAVSVIKSMSDQIHVVAECLNEKHRMLFDSVQCNAVVPSLKISDNLLVQEVNDPGVAQMVDVITSNIKGSTLFSSLVAEPLGSTPYNDLAKALLDKDINIICVNRGPQTCTSFRTLSPEAGDRVIYVAAERFEWSSLLRQAET
jgi:voltage-gated potassium channel